MYSRVDFQGESRLRLTQVIKYHTSENQDIMHKKTTFYAVFNLRTRMKFFIFIQSLHQKQGIFCSLFLRHYDLIVLVLIRWIRLTIYLMSPNGTTRAVLYVKLLQSDIIDMNIHYHFFFYIPGLWFIMYYSLINLKLSLYTYSGKIQIHITSTV